MEKKSSCSEEGWICDGKKKASNRFELQPTHDILWPSVAFSGQHGYPKLKSARVRFSFFVRHFCGSELAEKILKCAKSILLLWVKRVFYNWVLSSEQLLKSRTYEHFSLSTAWDSSNLTPRHQKSGWARFHPNASTWKASNCQKRCHLDLKDELKLFLKWKAD